MAENKQNAVKKVKIKMRRIQGQNADQTAFVSVNGENFLIKRCVEVEVPDYVAEVIEHSYEAEDTAYEYAEEMAIKEPK